MWVNVLVVLGVLAAVTVACLLKRAHDGRFRPVANPAGDSARPNAGPIGDSQPVGDQPIGDSQPIRGAESTRRPAATTVTEPDLGSPLGERATLVQFSSAFCAPCRATRRVLADVAAAVPGVRHIEVDAESNLELVRRLGVTRTPTTFIVDAAGRIQTRASGLAHRHAVVAALDAALDDPGKPGDTGRKR